MFRHIRPISSGMHANHDDDDDDENYDEDEDDYDDYDDDGEREEEDVWAYSGNFLWPAHTIQACLYHLPFIPLHLSLQMFQIVTLLYYFRFMHFVRLYLCLEMFPITTFTS